MEIMEFQFKSLIKSSKPMSESWSFKQSSSLNRFFDFALVVGLAKERKKRNGDL
jgi:hypothetical protein